MARKGNKKVKAASEEQALLQEEVVEEEKQVEEEKEEVEEAAKVSSKKSSAQKTKKGGVKRIIRKDTIENVGKKPLQRLFRVAGIERCSVHSYETVRTILKRNIDQVLSKAVIYMEHDRRSTLQIEDLENALKSCGLRLGAGINKNAKTQSLKGSVARTSTKKAPASEDKAEGEKKKHRFKPGTVARREVAFYQKHSDCLFIHKKNFQELVREVGQDYSEKIRYAGDMFDLFQLSMEYRIRKVLSNALLVARHANRAGVTSKDIHLAMTIMENKDNCLSA